MSTEREQVEVKNLRARVRKLERAEHERKHRPIKYYDQWCDACQGHPGLRHFPGHYFKEST